MRACAKTKITHILVALLIAAAPFFGFLPVHASPLSSRSVTLGSSLPSANTTHRFGFTIPGIAPVGSVEFEYCDNSPFIGEICTAPPGLNLSGAVLSGQTGETGFSIHPSSTSNRLVITRAPVATSALPVTYTFSNAINPNGSNKTVFVRLSTFASTDASGGRLDSGAVVFSTASAVTVQGYVPPYLTFCVGVTVTLDCTSGFGSRLDFGILTPAQTRFLSSEFSGATNDVGGFSTSVTGVTMTSGNNTIPALVSAQSSQPGVGQFGMNLRANSAPIVGQDSQGPGSSIAQPPLDTPNIFAFNNQIVTISSVPTDFRKFTASYIVNVAPSQKPGIYSTTLTYIAVAAF
jgi:hypothetical protein